MVGRIRQLYLFKSFRIDLIKKDREVGRLIQNLDWPWLMICTNEIIEKLPIPIGRI